MMNPTVLEADRLIFWFHSYDVLHENRKEHAESQSFESNRAGPEILAGGMAWLQEKSKQMKK